MFYRKYQIAKHERGLCYRNKDFDALLAPGTHRIPFWSLLTNRKTVQIVNTLNTKFEHPLLDIIVRDERVRDELMVLDLGDTERALVWKNDRLTYVLGPGRHAFWRAPADIAVEQYDVSEFRLEHRRLEPVLAHGWGKRLRPTRCERAPVPARRPCTIACDAICAMTTSDAKPTRFAAMC